MASHRKTRKTIRCKKCANKGKCNCRKPCTCKCKRCALCKKKSRTMRKR